LATGVLALECCFSGLMSEAVYGLRAGFFFLALTTWLSLRQAHYIAAGRGHQELESGNRARCLSPVQRRGSSGCQAEMMLLSDDTADEEKSKSA
jgi:hypothetical protein